MKTKETFICECFSKEHQVTFWWDEDDNKLYIQPHLSTNLNIFQRFWIAIRYIFGYKCKYGSWDEIIMSDENLEILKHFLEDKKKKEMYYGCK